MSPKISVIIPVWNGAKYLEETITSVLDQTYENIEIVVVDDGSTDNSQELLLKFKHQITTVPQENKGIGTARNTGVKNATGDYLAFLDQDDLWTKNKLTLQMQEMLKTSEEDPLIFSQAKQFISPDLPEEERIKIALPNVTLPGYVAGTLLISKKRFLQVGYFFEERMIGEFIEWYLRAVELKAPTKMLNEVTFHRRIHLTNTTRQTELFSRTDYLKILKASLDRRRALA